MLRIPRRAEVSAKVEPEARVLAMLKNRLPFAVPDWRVANAELVAYPMLEDSTAMVIQPGSSTPDWVVPQDSEVFAESFATALAALHAVPISAAVDAGCSSVHRRRPVRRWPTTLTASDASSW
ncbi:hypothetical protein ECZU20_54550 [Escherichia coli]|nr:hypothetical protein ECZU20_54550 [Escherichia coli]